MSLILQIHYVVNIKLIVQAREIVQLVKCLPYKHEDFIGFPALTLNKQKTGIAMFFCKCATPLLGRKRQKIPGANWPPRLAEPLSSGFSTGTLLKQERWKVMRTPSIDVQPLYPYTYVLYTHIYASHENITQKNGFHCYKMHEQQIHDAQTSPNQD